MLFIYCWEKTKVNTKFGLLLIAVITVIAASGAAQTPNVSGPKVNSEGKVIASGRPSQSSAVLSSNTTVATDANLKIAFIGDVGNGPNQRAVLSLIRSEGAQAVVHSGDFDYHGDPTGFWSSVDNILGSNFPYFVSVGNHDIGNWPTTAKPSYARYQLDRLDRLGIVPDSLELNNEMYSLVFKGLRIVFVGEKKGAGDSVYAPYIRTQLKSDNHTWKVCSWHRNMSAMQVGDKTDDMGWGVYEACREYGAIIATAHEHSYERTKTLSSFSDQTVDPNFPDPNRLVAAPGRTFAFVSALGGESIRVQRRCLPTSPPYGCKGEWAKIYTSNQNAQYGALFIIFHVNGDPNRAHGYFKTISGQIADEFDVSKGSDAPQQHPTGTAALRPSPGMNTIK